MSPAGVTFLLAAVLVVTAAVAMAAGPSGWKLPWASDLLLALRAPRVALAAVVGAQLAIAGVAMQAVVRNVLAEPYVLGMSGGAAVGAVSALALGAPAGVGAGAGAAAAVLVVRALCQGPFSPARLLLTGVTVGALAAGVAGLILALSPGQRLVRSAEAWLLGSVGVTGWQTIAAAAVLVAAAALWSRRRAAAVDRLALGDDIAAALGTEVGRVRFALVVVAVALTACAVALAGVIGFVGLVAPHAARTLTGAGHRHLVPAAALTGAILLVVADTAARTAFAPREVPVGLVTALIGGPWFLVLARRELA